MLTTEGIIVIIISRFSLSEWVHTIYKKPQFWGHNSLLSSVNHSVVTRHCAYCLCGSLRQNPSIKMTSKSKILFIGGTGYIGKYIVEASARSGHPTLVLVRNSTLTSPSRSITIENFKNLGVQFLLVRIVISLNAFLFPLRSFNGYY